VDKRNKKGIDPAAKKKMILPPSKVSMPSMRERNKNSKKWMETVANTHRDRRSTVVKQKGDIY
jgi:hypothetical protein